MSPRFTYCRKFWTLSLPFLLFLLLLFWYSLRVSRFSLHLITYILFMRQDFHCNSILIFFCFTVILLPYFLIYILLDFHGICIFHITVALQYFLVTLPFYRQYLMFDFPHIFHFYTVLQIVVSPWHWQCSELL